MHIIFWLLGVCFLLPKHNLIAQQAKDESVSVFLTLKSEAEVQGISAFLRVGPTELSPGEGFRPVGKNIWHSDTLTNISTLISIADTLKHSSGQSPELIYLLFQAEVDSVSLQTYFEDLLNNEIFIPTKKNEIPNSDGELILMGNKIPFQPFYKLKIQILSDFRMILLISVLSLFSITVLILVLVIFVVKTRKKNQNLLISRFKSLVYEPLCQLLFEFSLEELKEMNRDKILSFFPSRYADQLLFKDILIQEMISLNKNMKGDFKPKIKLIYRTLNLHERTLGKLKSKKWDVIATGISEANELDLVEAQSIIEKFVNSNNFYVRSQAIATLMNLSTDLKFGVLAAQNYPLSKWQQMYYLRIIKYKKSKGNIELLLGSANISVRVFAIKIIEVLGLVDQLELLGNRYQTATPEEKIATVKCFYSFGFVPDSNVFFEDLMSDKNDLVIPIIKLFTLIGEQEAIGIVLNRLTNETPFQLKKSILEFVFKTNRAIYEGYIKQNSSREIEAIHLHLTDPLLAHV